MAYGDPNESDFTDEGVNDLTEVMIEDVEDALCRVRETYERERIDMWQTRPNHVTEIHRAAHDAVFDRAIACEELHVKLTVWANQRLLERNQEVLDVYRSSMGEQTEILREMRGLLDQIIDRRP